MPSPSPVKCRGSVVRQLSLQNQSPLTPDSHRKLKKQLSEDDSRVLGSVRVTGQGWAAGTERPVPILRLDAATDSKMKLMRPKSVKVAWADRKPNSTECPLGVEVVATKCQGQPRPISIKAQRLRNPLLGTKDTLVYSRLQLAERLRNAWSEREKIKPNLNIFLAQASETTRSDSNALPSDRAFGDAQDAASTMSETFAPLDKKRKAMRVRAFSQDYTYPGLFPEKNGRPKPETPIKDDDKSPSSEDKSPEESSRALQELNKIEIRMTKSERNQSLVEEKKIQETPVGVKRCGNKENLGAESSAGGKSCEEEKRDAVSVVTAQDRRANFRRSSILQKTITESFSGRLPKEDEKTSEGGENTKAVAKPGQKKPPLVRAFSAPSHIDSPLKPTNQPNKVKIASQKRLQPSASFDVSNMNSEDISAWRERIKSAPIRRKLKSAAARRKNKDKAGDSSDEEKQSKEAAASKKTTRRNNGSKSGGDIVTMVSLVSPAASDAEDSVINLPMESWSGTEKEETPPADASSMPSEQTKDASTFQIPKFVSLRKTTKTVSFQSNPVLNRSYSASFPSRRAPAGTPIIIPTPVVNNPALTPAQLQDRDKRPPIFSAINSGADGRGIKRRLIRSSNEQPKEEESQEASQTTPGSEAVPSDITQDEDKVEEAETDSKTNAEPEFKSPKEKECWTLYQKMIEKGVTVSFDTVLRGMLTPTEYRLRRNSLLSTC